jgi:hypothetical protein
MNFSGRTVTDMARTLKEHRAINCKIEKEAYDMLESFITKTGLTKTVTVEKALKAYISTYNRTGRLQ